MVILSCLAEKNQNLNLREKSSVYGMQGNAANCPDSQLVGLFQLSLNVISKLADDFKILKS